MSLSFDSNGRSVKTKQQHKTDIQKGKDKLMSTLVHFLSFPRKCNHMDVILATQNYNNNDENDTKNVCKCLY